MSDPGPTGRGWSTQPSNLPDTPAHQDPNRGGQGANNYVDVDFIENEYRHLQSQVYDAHHQNVHLLQQLTPIVQQVSALTAVVSAVTCDKEKLHATFDLLQHTDGDKYKHPAIQTIMEENFELKAGNKALEDTVTILKAKMTDVLRENGLWVKEKIRMQVEWWMIRDTIRENATLKEENEELRREVAELQAMDVVGGKRKRAGKEKPDGFGILDI